MSALILLVLLAAADDPVLHVGKGVTEPKLLRKVDPKYSVEAERERIQGTALYSLVVDRTGHPRDIEVLSPIGYGLDEKGIEAIRQWTFAPAMKDGAAVSVHAQVEVNFRFPSIRFDEKREQFRTEYNRAIHELAMKDRKAKAVETIQQLAAKKFPPAMALLGEWMRAGSEVPKDPDGGLELIRRAAAQYDPEGMLALGQLYARGDGVPLDAAKSLKLLRDASMLGSVGAQIALGSKYAAGDGVTGDGVARDVEQSRQYYRLCAARGVGFCQLQLGLLLMPGAGGAKPNAVAAAAWLELAAENSVPEAEKSMSDALKELSPDERAAAAKLKGQLLRR